MSGDGKLLSVAYPGCGHRLACATVVAMLLSAPITARADSSKNTDAEPKPPSKLDLLDDDGVPPEPPRHGKLISALGLAGGYLTFSTWAQYAWYHNTAELPEFTVGGDGLFGRNTYAGGADKLGHAWANHLATYAGGRILEAGGWDTLPASVISASLSWTLFLLVEIKDGFYYQLSLGDMAGNTAGALFAALLLNSQRLNDTLDFRVQYFPSSDYRRELRNGDIDVAEDYSGQTYLLSVHLKAIPGLSSSPFGWWTQYIDVSAGFESRNYLPEPADPDAFKRQSLFLGVSLNLQHLLEESFGGRPKHWAHHAANGILEFYSPPYSTLRVSEATRRTPNR